jgi:enoyl-CoA hydratase/carnithine racemase
MASFKTYSKKYQTIRMRREDGILEMQFHTDGGSVQWGPIPHREVWEAFLDIGNDHENEIVIVTGAGKQFSGPRISPGQHDRARKPQTAEVWDKVYWQGKQLQQNLLNIDVPMISAVNGPAFRHAEIPLLCDIVLASNDAAFQDSGHFNGGMVPGDGMHIVFPLLLGANRGRYFLLTGQTISAKEALALGLVNEILPRAKLLPRAWELARQLKQRPVLVRRYARTLLTHDLKGRMHDLLGYGLALQGLATTHDPSSKKQRAAKTGPQKKSLRK